MLWGQGSHLTWVKYVFGTKIFTVKNRFYVPRMTRVTTNHCLFYTHLQQRLRLLHGVWTNHSFDIGDDGKRWVLFMALLMKVSESIGPADRVQHCAGGETEGRTPHWRDGVSSEWNPSYAFLLPIAGNTIPYRMKRFIAQKELGNRIPFPCSVAM
jgi:hypothetical protein